MAKKFIPVIGPSRFVEEFIAPSASVLLDEFHRTIGGELPSGNFFAIMRIDDYVQHIQFPITVSRNFHYDFFLLTNGQLVLTDGLQSYAATASSLIFRAAGSISGVDECSSDAEGFYGMFDAEYVLYNLKNQNSLNELPFFGPDALPVITLSADESLDFQRQLTKLDVEQRNRRPATQAFISALLYGFLLDAARVHGDRVHGEPALTGTTFSSTTGLTTRFRNLLKQYILSKRTVRDYADLLSVTPNHLNRSVKDTTGKTASNWIADALMLEAKVLLRQTDLTIAEIAFQLSIDDVSYFARLFKKQTGQSPSAYRDA